MLAGRWLAFCPQKPSSRNVWIMYPTYDRNINSTRSEGYGMLWESGIWFHITAHVCFRVCVCVCVCLCECISAFRQQLLNNWIHWAPTGRGTSHDHFNRYILWTNLMRLPQCRIAGSLANRHTQTICSVNPHCCDETLNLMSHLGSQCDRVPKHHSSYLL